MNIIFILIDTLSDGVNNILYSEFEEHLSSVCQTFDFAKKFMLNFMIILILLRLVVLIMNFVTSIIYHVKFRGDHIRTLMGAFKYDEKSYLNSKGWNLKKLSFYYSRKECINDIDAKNGEHHYFNFFNILVNCILNVF